MSVTLFPDLDRFTLKVEFQVKDHVCVSCPGRLAVVSDNFGAPAVVISGRYPMFRPLILNLTLNVKCLVRIHGCASCPGRPAIVQDIFCRRAGAISGWCPNLRYFIPDLEFDISDDFKNQNEGDFRVQRPKLHPGIRSGGNLNPSLNASLNTSLTSCSHCRK